jgi:hypothetical protein
MEKTQTLKVGVAGKVNDLLGTIGALGDALVCIGFATEVNLHDDTLPSLGNLIIEKVQEVREVLEMT